MKLFKKCVICYFHYLKGILNDDLFKEYINPAVLVNLKYLLYKKVYLFQLVAFKIYAAVKTFVSIGCHEHLPEAVTEVFFEISLNQKTLKLCTL